MRKIVFVLGGNATKQWDQKGYAGEQFENVRKISDGYDLKEVRL